MVLAFPHIAASKEGTTGQYVPYGSVCHLCVIVCVHTCENRACAALEELDFSIHYMAGVHSSFHAIITAIWDNQVAIIQHLSLKMDLVLQLYETASY